MTLQKSLFVLFTMLLSAYTFTSMRTLFPSTSVSKIYLVIVLLADLLLAYIMFNGNLREMMGSNAFWAILFSCLAGMVVVQVLWSVVLVVDDVRGVLTYLIKTGYAFYGKLQQDSSLPLEGGVRFSRSMFLQWFGFGIASFLYGMLGWGVGNRYNYKVRREKLHLEGLSNAWKGLTIVHISDIHCGSFSDHDAVSRGIHMISEIRPDIIFFTGDIVNNRSHELEQWQALLGTLHAPMGIFSVLGNHDYGDYVAWESSQAKQANLRRLKTMQKEMGWRLLLNEHIVLRKAGATDAIALIGVENWSALTRFKQYGDLKKSYKGSEHIPVKILLSHDPSHWEAEVLKKFPDINLTLSGHTHGMQFGVETPFFRWSPVQWVYRQWAGLYRKGRQCLYVNRGFGYIGYAGRVGIMPEITVLKLV